MDPILNFKVSGVFEMRRVAELVDCHPVFDTQSPFLASFNLDCEILLEVHMPISVVAFARDKSFNFASRVATSVISGCAREVATDPVAHLVEQLLAPRSSHLI